MNFINFEALTLPLFLNVMKRAAFFILAICFTVKALAYTGTGTVADASVTESPILVKTFSGAISGTLAMPNNAHDKVPLVLIIGDAGSVDRDGNDPKNGLTANTYKLLANALGANGIASLRYDKRLVGQSTSATKESQLRIDDYSDDAVSLIGFLGDDARFSKIILFGHGEGSLVAMIAIIDQPIAGFISAEGAADQADKILMERMKSKPKFLQDEFKVILDTLKKGKTYDNVDPILYNVARPSIQPFLMSWCRCVPIRGMKAIKHPVLIIQGATDLQTTPDNADKLKKAKADASLYVFKDMNHILKEAPADPDKNMATFSDPNLPLKPEMVKAVVDFINKLK